MEMDREYCDKLAARGIDVRWGRPDVGTECHRLGFDSRNGVQNASDDVAGDVCQTLTCVAAASWA